MSKPGKVRGHLNEQPPAIQRKSEDGCLIFSIYCKPQGLLVSRTEIVVGAGSSCFDMVSLFPDAASVMVALEHDAIKHENPHLLGLLTRDLHGLSCPLVIQSTSQKDSGHDALSC